MVQCFVPTCNHRSYQNDCKMFRFPTSPRKRWKWKQLIRRADVSPNKNARVCSCHFKEGDKNKLPEIFAWNKDKRFSPKLVQKTRDRPFGSVVRHLSFNEDTSSLETHSQSEGREDVSSFSTPPLDHITTDGYEKAFDPVLSPALVEGRGGYTSREKTVSVKAVVKGEEAATDLIQSLLTSNTRLHQEVEHLRSTQFTENTRLRDEVKSLQKRCTDNEDRNALLSAANDRLSLEVDSLKKRCSDNESENTLLLRAENDRLKLELESFKKRYSDVVISEAENTLLRFKVDKLKADLQKNDSVFRFRFISDSDKLVSHFTGLPNRQTFFALLKIFDNFDIVYSKKWNVIRLDKESQLLMTLMKFRRGLSNTDLAVRFKVEETTVANVFTSWIMALHHILVKNLMATVPSTKKNQMNLPECFKEYPQTRMIIDCTEVSTANPTLRIEIRCTATINTE